MSEPRQSDEEWLGAALERIECRLSRRGQPSWERRPGRRRLLALGACALLTAAVVSAAILGPRLAASSKGAALSSGKGTAFCSVRLPSAWTAAIQAGRTPVPLGSELAFAAAPNGKSYFADYTSAAWSGIVEVTPASHRTQPIYQFQGALAQDRANVAGAFDGRWLVWSTSPATDDLPTTLMAWDSVTGQVSTIDNAGASGTIDFELDDRSPGAALGWLAYTTLPGVDAGFMLVQLSNGASHYLQLPRLAGVVGVRDGFFSGSLFVYEVPRTQSRDGAIEMGSWSRAPLPAALRSPLEALRQSPSAIALDQKGAIWSEPSGLLRVRLAGDSNAYKLGNLAKGGFVTITGPIGFWTDPDGAMYVADLRSHSFAKLPVSDGWAIPAGPQLLLYWNPAHPSVQPSAARSHLAILDTRALPRLPACRS